MTTRPIILAPDPALKRKANPVGRVDNDVRALMADMLETMYAAPGIGLAAPQVGVPARVVVIDLAGPKEPPQPLRIADPEILWTSAEMQDYQEGCLSFPDQYADVTRPAEVRIRYRDETDTVRELHAQGLLATCVQHEIDHLDGILFTDHLSALKRNMILRRMVKLKKLGEVA